MLNNKKIYQTQDGQQKWREKLFDWLKSIKFQAFASLRDQQTELGESVSFPLLLVGWANIAILSGVLVGFSNGHALGVR